MPVLINDPYLEERIRAERADPEVNCRDEVWEGVLVVPASPNTEHQRLVMGLAYAFTSVVNLNGGDTVLPGANVSDRDADWMKNYRIPDVVVYLASNPAKDRGSHWVGGPDVAVEVASPGEDPQAKFDFYARVNTREVLIVDRYPWAVELHKLQAGKLVLVGKSDQANQASLSSGVMPLTFRLQPGTLRPTILVTHNTTGQTWTA